MRLCLWVLGRVAPLLAADRGAPNPTQSSITNFEHMFRAANASRWSHNDAVVLPDLKRLISPRDATPPLQHLASSPRILMYLTTACSSCHLKYLQESWPRSMQAAQLLVHADVLVYAGCGGAGPKERFEWAEALTRLPNANVSLAWRAFNPGYQQGAKEGMAYPVRHGWFDAYDWVIRVNPDVVIMDATFLETKLRETNTTAVLVKCVRWRNRTTVFDTRIHTDFFAARPPSMDSKHWLGRMPTNAESTATLAFASAIKRKEAFVFDNGNIKGICRVINKDYGIIHEHTLCMRSKAERSV